MNEILMMNKINKIYPNGVVANKDVDFSVRRGEIHALVGENGAGKSTLMKILFGIEKPTEGSIYYKGKKLIINSPLDAINYGFGMVHQHFMLVESMSVSENIVLGSEPGSSWKINSNIQDEEAKKIIEKYNFKINVKAKISDLSIGLRQKVEILKALYKGAEVLILDEPTAVLTPQETVELFEQLKALKAQGHTIIFISHKLNEIKEICDRISIMRNGTLVGVYDVNAVTKDEISDLMVGKSVNWEVLKTPTKKGKVLLKVKNLTVINEANFPCLKHVSFNLHSSTILGIVGVEGNGQKELVDSIAGLTKIESGEIILKDKKINTSSVEKIRELGLSHIPGDRMVRGIANESTIEENLLATHTKDERLFHKGFLKTKEIRKWSEELISEFQIKASSPKVPIKMLSGGNIQKVIVAREFSKNSDCIIANQPTRGIDIGAAKFIHLKLIELRDKGAGVLLLSADLSEIKSMSDSLLVIFNGQFVAYFEDANKVTEEQLGKFMLGVEKQDEKEIKRCEA
ncbi:MAG: ABC transporter ATP-binding protein [Sphaerochaetaceae bacterium]